MSFIGTITSEGTVVLPADAKLASGALVRVEVLRPEDAAKAQKKIPTSSGKDAPDDPFFSDRKVYRGRTPKHLPVRRRKGADHLGIPGLPDSPTPSQR